MAQQSEVGRTATTIANVGDYTVVTYHQTAVVKFNNREVILNSGGWWTMTTKTRMNQASHQFGLGFSVSQRGGEWFVDYLGKREPFGNFYVEENTKHRIVR